MVARRTVFALVGIAAATTIPMGASLGPQQVVTGHAVFAGMDGFDPCLAAVVGLVRLRVMWFDDVVLFERPATDGSGYVYAIEAGAPDPRNQKLVVTGEHYDFRDPNGQAWNVTEYRFQHVKGTVEAEPSEGSAVTTTFYTWIVRIGPTTQDNFPGLDSHSDYNFVTLVDACKFNDSDDGSVSHTRDSNGNMTTNRTDDPTQGGGHFDSDADHAHEMFDVDLYVGREPNAIVPPNAPPVNREVDA